MATARSDELVGLHLATRISGYDFFRDTPRLRFLPKSNRQLSFFLRATKVATPAHPRAPKMNYIEQIQHQAEQVFGNKEKADAWLNQPKKALGDRAPLELARDAAGYSLVRDELERISHGYFA
jgi:hypothetical protein